MSLTPLPPGLGAKCWNGGVSDAKQIRPGQVTMAAWMIMVGSAIVVLSVFDQLGSFNTVEAREGIEKFLGEPPAKGLGLSTDAALTLLRVMAMVAAGCATAAAVLGWHVLKRHRPSRVALTVVAVPLFFTGMVAGGFFSSLVAASALMLWTRPARDWFDGVTRPRREVVHPSGAREPGSEPATSQASRSQAAPYAGFGALTGVGTADRTRPAQVTWACLLTWGFCAMTIVTLVAGAVGLIADSSGAIDEAMRQNPDLVDAGMSERELLIGAVLVIGALLIWTVLAIVVAWFVWKGRDWARVILICSAGLAAGLGVLAVLINVIALPLLIAGGVAMRLLLGRQAAAWCRPKAPVNFN
jgi:hypothetical protein